MKVLVTGATGVHGPRGIPAGVEGVPLAAAADGVTSGTWMPDTASRASRAQAERTAIALSQALAAAMRERAARLVAVGVLADAAHFTWDELLAPPADMAAVAQRRRAEHERLQAPSLPHTISVIAPGSAISLGDLPAMEREAAAV